MRGVPFVASTRSNYGSDSASNSSAR